VAHTHAGKIRWSVIGAPSAFPVRLTSRNSLARLPKDYNSTLLWHGEAVAVSRGTTGRMDRDGARMISLKDDRQR
jgi:hypothetical protein